MSQDSTGNNLITGGIWKPSQQEFTIQDDEVIEGP